MTISTLGCFMTSFTVTGRGGVDLDGDKILVGNLSREGSPIDGCIDSPVDIIVELFAFCVSLLRRISTRDDGRVLLRSLLRRGGFNSIADLGRCRVD